ncbi:outer membrane lipoprotein carrier protein LolA [Caedibacter taeniospiralis]|jgi:outer membrane lipoprotein-sorting protein|uniref:outer membrane lipoprotein carrier protein LolA n=1 Tax=Caedibacter taeniospiralis TaxID=28907 RepID=UPI0037C141A6
MIKTIQKLLLIGFLSICVTLDLAHAEASDDIFNHPLSAKNQLAFDKVQQEQAKIDHVYGQFIQIRHMKLLSKPLKSSGTFELSKKNGLKWLQEKPFQSTLIITSDKIEQSIEGNPAITITKKEQPIVFSFTTIFLSIFKGNAEALKQYFHIYFTQNNDSWHIALKPRGSPLDKAIQSIEMTGEKYASRILVNEAQGNQMSIEFSNVKEINTK